jgi:hypothetical protein
MLIANSPACKPSASASFGLFVVTTKIRSNEAVLRSSTRHRKHFTIIELALEFRSAFNRKILRLVNRWDAGGNDITDANVVGSLFKGKNWRIAEENPRSRLWQLLQPIKPLTAKPTGLRAVVCK